MPLINTKPALNTDSIQRTIENNSPYIFDIQRFSIHDGPGIRTVIFTKGCPLNCVWCQNPESQQSKAQVAFYSENCKDCRKCIDVCPVGAIDEITKISDYSTCTTCGACVDICINDARRMIGQKMNEKDIINELLKDIDFYGDSNGGITFSGGEPLTKPEFLYGILRSLKENKIHINIETSGQFDFEKIVDLLPYIDLIYFDIKHLDNQTHKKFTGLTNTTILSNFEKLNRIFKNVQVRIPLIPGVNDSIVDIELFCNYLLENGHNTAHLLPYHNMGNSKAVRIDYNAEIFKVEPHSKEEIEKIKSQFSNFGITPITYD